MLSLSEIERFYPNNQRVFKRNILREYLQYKILEIVFNSDYTNKLAFMGGTCLKIVFSTNRFSEDLDFDNFGLTIEEFETLSKIIAKNLESEGYLVEIKIINKGAFHCYIKIPNLLFNFELSGYKEEKILIQLDSENQPFQYSPSSFLLNKFDVFTEIFHTPQDILLAQKLWAIINRKNTKGRDIYDSIFLFSITKPDYDYLYSNCKISNLKELKDMINNKLIDINLNQLTEDIRPFIINSTDIERIKLFPQLINSLK